MHFLRSSILVFAVFLGIGSILRFSEQEYNRADTVDPLWRAPALVVPEFPADNFHAAAPAQDIVDEGGEEVIVPIEILSAVDLPVPFTSQFPTRSTAMPYREACEESSVLMVLRYFSQEDISSTEDAAEGIQDLVERNVNVFGDSIDESAAEVRDLLLEQSSDLSVQLLTNPSITDLQRELSQGHVLLVPVSAEVLDNPNFTPPPPDYHMIIIRGYTEDEFFITNEPGSKKGEGHLYSYETIMEAIGDLQDGKAEGEKVVVVVGK